MNIRLLAVVLFPRIAMFPEIVVAPALSVPVVLITVLPLMIDPLPIVEPEIVGPISVLLVNVSTVLRPTRVSVVTGRVSVPVLAIELITGEIKVLLVSVSVVARPTKVSVLVGSVSTPVLEIVLKIGSISVLLVKVAGAASVTTTPLTGNTALELTPIPPLLVGKTPVTASDWERSTAPKTGLPPSLGTVRL